MNISFIVAMSENRIIGNQGRLPWHLPNDLRHFKQLTIGKNILMGRKTFEAIGRPLPHRNNFVLTKKCDFLQADDVKVFHSKEEVLQSGIGELIVIGGEEIFRLFLPECRKIYLTLVHIEVFGDTRFPELHDFTEISREVHEIDERHPYRYSFIEYARLR